PEPRHGRRPPRRPRRRPPGVDPMTPLVVGLDVDNVLYPFSTVFCRWAERERGLPPGTLDDVALSWTWYKSQFGPYTMTSAQFVETFARGVRSGVIYTEGDPM